MAKVHHWKHGWIPLDSFARGVLAKRKGQDNSTGRVAFPTPVSALTGSDRSDRPGFRPAPGRDSLKRAPGTTIYSSAVYRDPARPDKVDGVTVNTPQDEDRLNESWNTAGALLRRYKRVEPTVTPGLIRLAAANGGFMQGLDYRLKNQESLARKLYNKSQSKGLTVGEYGNRIGDALRYTFIAPDTDYGNASQKFIDSLRAEGYTVVVENTWRPGAEYKGLNTNVSKGGHTYELQLHTAESFRVKMAQHGLYETSRSTNASPEERAAANRQMAENMANLATPPGAEGVH